MAGMPRHRLATVFVGSALLWLATGGVAAAQSPQARLTARAAHIGVVVTNRRGLRQLAPARGAGEDRRPPRPAGCPQHDRRGRRRRRGLAPARDRPLGQARHDLLLQRLPPRPHPASPPARAVTGTVNVPDTCNVPPAQAPPPLSAPTIAHTKLDPALVHRLEVGALAAVAAALLALVLLAAAPPRRPRAHGAAADRPRVDRRPQLGRACRPRHDPARLDRRRDRIRGAAVSGQRVSRGTLPAPRRARRRRLRRRAAPGRVRGGDHAHRRAGRERRSGGAASTTPAS